MAVVPLKDALRILRIQPLLWVPGLVGGVLASILWLMITTWGTFFASRLMVFFSLFFLVFVAGMMAVIKDGGGNLRSMILSGTRSYFGFLLPQLVILFGILLVLVLVAVTFSFFAPYSEIFFMTMLAFGITIPVMLFTFFSDTAAVFEDRRVFDSIQRSISLVTANIWETFSFFIISGALFSVITFLIMLFWEAALYDKLEPLTRFTDEQMQAFMPEDLIALIGPDGVWVTALFIFIGVFILVPVLYTYKACFYKALVTRKGIAIQQTTGEYDEKGRWYKY
jgi:hypothetical protein